MLLVLIVASLPCGVLVEPALLTMDTRGEEPSLSDYTQSSATSTVLFIDWNKTYGGVSGDEALSVVQTNDGGYAIAGRTTSFGASSSDFWLVKTDPAGNIVWNQIYGGADYERAESVVQTTDGGYAIAGCTTSFGAGIWDYWLVKTDSTGNMQWNHTYDRTTVDYVWSVVQTSDGGYALAGSSGSFSNAELSDFWLVKTDSTGNMLWNQAYGGENSDSGSSVVQTTDGGYAIAGCTTSFGAGGDDFWLVKTDSTGNMLWNHTFGGEGNDEALSVVQTNDGGYAIAGYTTSFDPNATSDAWLIKLGVGMSPTASFTFSPLLPNVEELVTFDASASIDPDGWIDSYIWNFGDDNTITVTISIVTHAYTAPGTYHVILTATDNHGITHSTTKTITIETQEETWPNISLYILAGVTIVIIIIIARADRIIEILWKPIKKSKRSKERDGKNS